MITELPAYSGPGGQCPKCGADCVKTEYHWAGGVWAPKKTFDRESPCKGIQTLSEIGGGSEHLCRVCLNCGHGWPEACIDASDKESSGQCMTSR